MCVIANCAHVRRWGHLFFRDSKGQCFGQDREDTRARLADALCAPDGASMQMAPAEPLANGHSPASHAEPM